MEQDSTFQVHVEDTQFIKTSQEIGTLFFQMVQDLTQQDLMQEDNSSLIKMDTYSNLITTKLENTSQGPMLEKLSPLTLMDTFTQSIPMEQPLTQPVQTQVSPSKKIHKVTSTDQILMAPKHMSLVPTLEKLHSLIPLDSHINLILMEAEHI